MEPKVKEIIVLEYYTKDAVKAKRSRMKILQGIPYISQIWVRVFNQNEFDEYREARDELA